MRQSRWIKWLCVLVFSIGTVVLAKDYTYIDFWLENRSPNNLYIQICYEGERIGPNESKYGRISAGKKLHCGHMRVGAIINFYERDGNRYVPVWSMPIVQGMNNDTTVIGSRE